MSELINVNTDLLYRVGDKCSVTIHCSYYPMDKIPTGQAIQGRVTLLGDDFISVLTNIPDPKGGMLHLQISTLSTIIRDVSFHVELTPEETKKRILKIIGEQRDNLIKKHDADIAGCDNAEKHLLSKYGLATDD